MPKRNPAKAQQATNYRLQAFIGMAAKYSDQDFLEYVVKSLVNTPDAVKVERTVDERGVLLTLHIDPKDMGYVIGRQGQTAHSLRTLLRIVGAKNNARVNMKIYEPEGSTHGRRPSADVGADDLGL